MTNLPVIIEQMQPRHAREVSFVLAHGFEGKLAALTSLDTASLAGCLEQLQAQFPDGPLTRRVVALQGAEVIGTLSLKWRKRHDSFTAAAVHSSGPAKPPFWGGIRQLGARYGTKNTLLLLTALLFLNHDPSPGECYIADLAVHPGHQGKGVGEMLVRWAQQDIREQPQLHYLGLHVSGRNGQARRLYERLAFSIEAEEGSLLRSFLFNEKKWTYMICRQ